MKKSTENDKLANLKLTMCW